MATRTTSVGTQSNSDFLSSAEYNSAAGGWIGYVTRTSDVSSLTTSDDTLTGVTVTVTVGTSRYIKITVFGRMISTVANDDANINIKESTTVLTGSTFTLNRTTLPYGHTVEKVLAAPSSGSHTYFATGGLAAGTGSLTLKADATRPAWILVEDLGST